MKKILLLFAFVLAVTVSFGQRTVLGTITDAGGVTMETLQGAKQVQVLAEQLTGTIAGSLTFEASVDGVSFETITETADLIHFYPNDTLTLADGAVWFITIKDKDAFKYVRVVGTSSGTQSTELTLKWSK